MKKTFPQRNWTKSGSRTRIFFAAGIVLIVLAIFSVKANLKLDFLSKQTWAGNLSRYFLSFGQSLRTRASLERELEATKLENEELKGANRDLEVQLDSLGRIKDLLGEKNSGLVAMVKSIFPEGPFDTILIDKGAADGIQEGNSATLYGVYLGQIAETSEHSAQIKMVSFPGMRTEGFIASASLNISLEGRGGGNISFLLPKNIEIKKGDKVFANTTPALVIGEVAQITEHGAEPLKEILLRIPLNMRSLRFVEILQ